MLHEISYIRPLSYPEKKKLVTSHKLHSPFNSITLALGVKHPNFVGDVFKSHNLIFFFSDIKCM